MLDTCLIYGSADNLFEKAKSSICYRLKDNLIRF